MQIGKLLGGAREEKGREKGDRSVLFVRVVESKKRAEGK